MARLCGGFGSVDFSRFQSTEIDQTKPNRPADGGERSGDADGKSDVP
ncbi:MAG: hypothetical protein LBD35_05640 [Prevotellaceae bacterium]|jgi:hypothetical protein|nr:hypothetical protein [Prevotellaceae bacterium]